MPFPAPSAQATANLENFKRIAHGIDAQHEMTAFRLVA